MKRILALTVSALAAVACSSQVSTPPNTTPPGSSTTTAAPGTTGPAVEQFSFVRAIDDAEIRFDPALFLTGEAAIEAAQKDGVLAEGETLPNDFYISNPDQEETVAALESGGSYVLVGFDANGALADRELSLEDFVAVLNGANNEAFYGIIPGDMPMILTISGDTVVGARQQYLP